MARKHNSFMYTVVLICGIGILFEKCVWRGGDVWAGNIWNVSGFYIFLNAYIFLPLLYVESGYDLGSVAGGGCVRRIAGMIMDLIFFLLLIFVYRNYMDSEYYAGNIWNDSGF